MDPMDEKSWKQLLNQQFQDIYFCCLSNDDDSQGPELQYFHIDGPMMGNRIMKHFHKSCCASLRAAYKCD